MSERDIFLQALEIEDPTARAEFLGRECAGDGALRARVESLIASHGAVSRFLEVPAVEQLQGRIGDEAAATRDFDRRASRGDSGASSVTNDVPARYDVRSDDVQRERQDVGNSTTRSENDDDESPGVDLSFLPPSQKPGSLGTLGHYEILAVVGQGAFGIVLKAFDEKLHRLVAIKVMAPQLAATSPPRKRFLREARSAAAVKHENVVQVHDTEERPIPYLVMEYVDGQTLQQKLEASGPLEPRELLHLARQMAAGLAAAHAQGLIHRDIKPGNILIEHGADAKVKLTDFGLARTVDDASMTRTGMIAGTPMYMAPEQALGQPLDPRADLFSLGSVLYQMASGRPPFRAPTAVAVLKRVAEEKPRPIRDIIPDAPTWLCAIVEKLHAKNPDERFASARELHDLLARCQEELRQTGRVTCVEGCQDDAPGAEWKLLGAAAAKCKPRSVPARNRRLVALSVIVGLVVIVGLGGFALFFGPATWIGLHGRAQVNVSTGPEMRLELWRDGQIAHSQLGHGTFQAPAGRYQLRATHVDPDRMIVELFFARRSWLRTIEYTTLPMADDSEIELHAGETVSIVPSRINLRQGQGKSKQKGTSPPGAVVAKPSFAPDSVVSPAVDDPALTLDDGWTPLFNGRDLTGWTTSPGQPGNWHVENGVLVGSGPPSYLFSERDDFGDFHLRCQAKINVGGDGGIIIRSPDLRATKMGLQGYEAQLQGGRPLARGWQMGAIASSDPKLGWRLLEKTYETAPADAWVTLEVIAKGNQLETRVSGRTVATHTDPKSQYSRGRIALQQSGAGTIVQFRSLQIRELTSEAPTARKGTASDPK